MLNIHHLQYQSSTASTLFGFSCYYLVVFALKYSFCSHLWCDNKHVLYEFRHLGVLLAQFLSLKKHVVVFTEDNKRYEM